MRVLLVGCTESMAASMPADVEVVQLDPAAPGPTPRPGVLVVGPRVVEPLSLAQRLCRGGSLELVLAPEETAVSATTAQLAITPFIPLESRVVPAQDVAAVRVAVAAGIERARRQKRQSAVAMAAQRSLGRGTDAPAAASKRLPQPLEEHREAVLAFLDVYDRVAQPDALPASAREGVDIVGPADDARRAIRDRQWVPFAARLRKIVVTSLDPLAELAAVSPLGALRRAVMRSLFEQPALDTLQVLTGMDAFVEACEMEMAGARRGAQRADLKRAWTRERLFGSIVETTDDAVVSTDVDGVITGWNRGAEKLYGHTEAEAIGRGLHDLLYDGAHRELFEGVAREGVALRNLEMDRKTRDGQVVRVAITLAPITLPLHDRVVGLSEISRDITEGARDRAWRNATVKGALDGIVTMDHRGAIVEMNDAAQKLFGYTVEEVRGRPLADVIIPERLREDHRRGLARYVETGQSGVLNERLDLTAMRSDGSEFPAEVSIVELEGLVPPLFAGFVRDQTALRAARADLQRTIESLERSNADLERFAYLASHDLQEPLRMVSAYLQLLQQQAGGALDDQALAFLDYAKEGAARMRTLIDGLLALARVDSRGARFDWVALDDVVRTALATLRMLAADTQARIDVSPLPKVWGDEAQLASVFENLVGNALIHGGDAPPRIEIGARREGGDWVLAVRDHGVGFEPRQNERIFEIFHAIERDTNTESRQSTGVGLAIVRRIVQRHGGAIWAEGRPGEGATFTFTLRAAPPDGSSSSEHDRGDE